MKMFKKINEKIRTYLLNGIIISVYLVLSGAFCWALQYSLLLPVFLLFVGIHLYYSKTANLRTFLYLGLLLSLLIAAAYAIINFSTVSYYYIPVAIVSMLTILLFNDLHLTFMMTLVSSLIVSIMLGAGYQEMIIFFVGGMVGAYASHEARTRGRLIGAGLFIGIAHIVCLFLINWNHLESLGSHFAMTQLYPLAVNGFICAFFVMGSLKVFEYLFGVLTNFSLLELADFNQPLLKRLILEAPGTYHHSLVVSNLAEAAADAIGVNSLLARVGAYYHDIGKLLKPEYFTENQVMQGNKHDFIEPSMSRLVILNHVKEGLELARKSKLNERIADFIPQHHGTSIVYYFYKKALESAQEGERINEDNYRYPGPKPQTKETAITMMADSIEAAVRALDEKSPNKIEETVKRIANNKFIDGQLDACNLTLKEIDKICATFTRILASMYHARVKYPEKINANISQQSTKENQS